MKQGTKTTEPLNHFNCWLCHKWWTVGDSPKNKKIWFCPWCGTKQGFKIKGKMLK